jgi:hypothetical protein
MSVFVSELNLQSGQLLLPGEDESLFHTMRE